jgi:di/tricarboxylate transporter
MFEFSTLGLVFFAAGTVYMLTIGRWLVPSRRDPEPLTIGFGLGDYVTDVKLLPEAASVGRTIGDAPLLARSGVRVLRIVRDGQRKVLPSDDVVLEAGDVLRLLCRVDDIARLRDRSGIAFEAASSNDEDLESDDVRLVEVVIPPSSPAAGKTANAARLGRFGAILLALRQRHGGLIRADVGAVTLRPGDALLLEIPRSRIQDLQQQKEFLVVSDLEIPLPRHRHTPIAVAIMIAVVVLAATGVMSIAVSAVAGAALMVLSRCLTPDEAYDAIEWRVLFLIAGMLALGAAMDKTGAARLLADGILSYVDWAGPTAILCVLYLMTSLLTEVLSNNAAIALLAPIAIATAEAAGVSARPFLIAVMFAASSSFMTPIGYQTNTMIYGPGRYKFRDFLRVGAPLNLLFWLLATLLIPYLWPFT